MQAIVFHQYGSPDVLQFAEIEAPIPKDDQVLIKVHAASANPLDWHRMRGAPFIARLDGGLRKPTVTTLGADVAGRVEAVGQNVSKFQPGDEVFGVANGSFAEYVCANEARIAIKPASLAFEAAAAAPVAAITALQGLRDTGKLQAGQNVLINGAAGGVGSFAVQIAKALGAVVTGVCSARNLDLARSLGADQVIDYQREDFTQARPRYDLIYDAVGNHSVLDYQRALTPGGICAIAGFTTLPRLFEHMLVGPMLSRATGKQVGLMGLANVTTADLLALKALVEAGQVTPLIDRCYLLAQAAEAIRYLEAGHARGKVVVRVQ